ncbi:MAG: PEP-CTERM sorting domain-containing protein [Methylophilus sp.]|uniref:PEP-CTERM sorting domain-containing protein n=3 Tax=Methylophilus sp. TaxID=29541 RepID=UPI004036DF4D
MKRSRHHFKFAKFALLASLVTGAVINTNPVFAAQTTYRLSYLEAFTKTGGSAAQDINNQGQIVGSSWLLGGNGMAAIWNNNQISALGGPSRGSSAWAINNAGVVVGLNHDGSRQNAMQWENAQESVLVTQTCCSGTSAQAMDVNNHGVVAGWTNHSNDGQSGAVIWTNGNKQFLPGLQAGSNGSFASGINDLGQVAGLSTNQLGYQHATLWSNGTVTDLGRVAGFSASFAERINNAGDVVGQSSNGFLTAMHATLWRDGQIIDLGSLNGGADASVAKDINNAGQIVGYSFVDPSNYNSLSKAVIWSDNLTAINLETLIDVQDPLYGKASLAAAWGINDLGQIVGWGWVGGQQQAFLLNPVSSVPEPESYAMLLLGLAGIAVHRRKTQK